jgi:hypothetical protein
MRRIITTYLLVIVLLSIGFFGVGALSAQELRDPMQPPALALQKFRLAKLAGQPTPAKASVEKSVRKPLQLTSILFSKDRKIAIIDDQMLAVGDSIRGARLVKLTRESAHLVRKGKALDLSLDNDLTAIRKQAVESDL